MSEERSAPVWYGVCGHWTSDWSKLKRAGVPAALAAADPALAARMAGMAGIPICPIDGAPGYHASPAWWSEVDEFEAAGHPGYGEHVAAMELP